MMIVVFAAILGVNMAVNWIETGHAIALEDYGNLDVYLANNEKAPADWYHSGKVPEFASARYNEIVSDASLTRYEQNELAGRALHEYVTANTGTVVHNAGVKFYKLFFETWGVVWYAFLVCFALQMALKGLKWPNKAYLGWVVVILSVLPAFGLLVARYSAPMLPLFIAFIVGTAGQAACAVATKPAVEKPAAETVPEPAPVVREKEEAVAEAKPEPIEEETTTEAKPTAVPEEKAEEPVAPVEVPVAPEAAPVEEPAPVEEKIEEPKAEEPHKPISLAEEIRTKSAHELAAELFPKKPKPKAPENSPEPPIAK